MGGFTSLLSLLRRMRAERDAPGLALLGALCGYGALALALPFWPALARFELTRFHLQTASLVGWASLQPYPWMYNFENWLLVSPTPLSRSVLEGAHAPRFRAINHHGARAFTWFEGRATHLSAVGSRYLYLRSRYRDEVVFHCLHAELTDPPGPAARPTRVEACEIAP